MKIFKILTVIGLLCFNFSCEDITPEAPSACLTAEVLQAQTDGSPVYVLATTVKVGKPIFFSACSKADKLVIFTGDEGHDYDNHDDTGAYFSNADGVRYQYSYQKAGNYTVVLLATNLSAGEINVEAMSDTAFLNITVTE